MKRWHVGETVRNRQDEAALSVTPLGMEAYVPGIMRSRKRGHHIIEEEEPRFGCYIFLRFDRDSDRWPDLLRGRGPLNAYFHRILCDLDYRYDPPRPVPVPVPERAMEAIMAYQPPKIGEPTPTVFQPGQAISWIEAGVRREGIFVEYRGKRQSRPFIRAWRFGAERIIEVSKHQLEAAVEAA